MYIVHLNHSPEITMTATTAAPTTSTGTAGVPSRTASHAILLRVEGFALLVASLLAYRWMLDTTPGAWGWWSFAALFLMPDLAMLGFLRSPALGNQAYNLAHTESIPAAVLGLALLLNSPALASTALIWLAHVGFDRAAGYGLKVGRFNATHLGVIGNG
jgi:Domain of unknown function (DUF4260)